MLPLALNERRCDTPETTWEDLDIKCWEVADTCAVPLRQFMLLVEVYPILLLFAFKLTGLLLNLLSDNTEVISEIIMTADLRDERDCRNEDAGTLKLAVEAITE